MADGRTRAFLNDQPVSAGLLRQIGAVLVEVHGQHDDRALVDPDSHRAVLDAFGGLEGDAGSLAAHFAAWKQAMRDLAAQQARIEDARREADYLAASVEELSKLKPKAGEELQLAEARARMMAAEKVAGDLAEAHEALSGSGSPIPELSSLLRRMERKADKAGPIAGAATETLARALDLRRGTQRL